MNTRIQRPHTDMYTLMLRHLVSPNHLLSLCGSLSVPQHNLNPLVSPTGTLCLRRYILSTCIGSYLSIHTNIEETFRAQHEM